jgi:glycosyltransferase involved in cell wall biosynthesis
LAVNPTPAADDIELTVLMPCLNEAETLNACILKARGFLDRSGIRGEIVVGDNGSTDGSQALARSLGARVVDVPARGYGAALFHGARAARGRFVIMGDSDDSYDFSSLDALVEKLREGCDLVMGNRFKGGIAPGAMPWKNRWIGNPALSFIGRLFFNCPVGDFWCGLRGFSRQAFDKLDLRSIGMEFALEMVIKATLHGLKIAEVPVTLSPDGRSRPPHLRPWRDGWRGLRFMLLFSPRWLFLYPGLLLMWGGLAAGAWLLPGRRDVGSIHLDYNTLLYAAMAVLLGFQAASFAIFSKIYTIQEGLRPPDGRLDRFMGGRVVETGLLLGGGLVLAGLAGSALAVWHWRSLGFGDLDASRSLRMVIPSVLALALGAQIIFASMFLGVLRLRTRQSG